MRKTVSNQHIAGGNIVKTLAVKTLAIAAGCLAILPAVQAAAPRAEQPVRFVVSAGITAGGDTIEELDYRHGGSVKIKGGGLVQLGAGLQWHPQGAPFSMLATLNYHVDNATARNGDARFDRIPVEVLGFYHFNNWWRIGGGWRHTMNPKFSEDIDNQPSVDIKYKDANSVVVQLGFGTERLWGGLRYVNESFDAKTARVGNTTYSYTHTDDGSHVGLLAYFAF